MTWKQSLHSPPWSSACCPGPHPPPWSCSSSQGESVELQASPSSASAHSGRCNCLFSHRTWTEPRRNQISRTLAFYKYHIFHDDHDGKLLGQYTSMQVIVIFSRRSSSQRWLSGCRPKNSAFFWDIWKPLWGKRGLVRRAAIHPSQECGWTLPISEAPGWGSSPGLPSCISRPPKLRLPLAPPNIQHHLHLARGLPTMTVTGLWFIIIKGESMIRNLNVAF